MVHEAYSIRSQVLQKHDIALALFVRQGASPGRMVFVPDNAVENQTTTVQNKIPARNLQLLDTDVHIILV